MCIYNSIAYALPHIVGKDSHRMGRGQDSIHTVNSASWGGGILVFSSGPSLRSERCWLNCAGPGVDEAAHGGSCSHLLLVRTAGKTLGYCDDHLQQRVSL